MIVHEKSPVRHRRHLALCLAVAGVLTAWPIGSGAARSAVRPAQAAAAVTPFRIAVPEAVLADLRERLTRTRFPDEIEGSGWTYGTNLAYLRELVEYWRTDYDWREHEGRLNRFPQFTTTIDDLEIHFIHQRSSHADALPLLLLHGWPSSFYEFTIQPGPLDRDSARGSLRRVRGAAPAGRGRARVLPRSARPLNAAGRVLPHPTSRRPAARRPR